MKNEQQEIEKKTFFPITQVNEKTYNMLYRSHRSKLIMQTTIFTFRRAGGHKNMSISRMLIISTYRGRNPDPL